MLMEKKEGVGKKSNGHIVIGYDLNGTYAQISYYILGAKDVETLAVVAGTEQYNIPMVLCKRKEINQWFFGKEAIKAAEAGEGDKVEDLIGLARTGELVDVGGESFDPVALLTLFVKRSLSLLNIIAPPGYLAGMMFTIDNLDNRMIEILSKTAANLQLKTDNIFFQSHVESYYHYAMHQPGELRTYKVLLCDYDNKRLKIYTLDTNKKTTPIVVYVDVDEYGEMEREDPGVLPADELQKSRLDETFLGIIKEKCNGKAVSCAYLIGDGYKDGWAHESLKYLCRGRRVFQGNNLYSKGACYGIRKRLGWEEAETEYVFLGLDKLKANIGMKVLKRGTDSYYAIMDAGVNWFEAKREFDIILESGDAISIMLTPLNGKDARDISMILEGLGERPEWTTRLRIRAEMISEEELSIEVEDMGFGEFFPASGGKWIKTFNI